MRTLLLSITLLLLASAPASAQGDFSATFELRRADANGAVVRGTISYDSAFHRIRYDYTGRQYREVLKYDDPTRPPTVARLTQRRYEIGESCEGGCRARPIDHGFPVYRNDPAVYAPTGAPTITVDGRTCAEVAPHPGVDTPLAKVWFAADGVLCRALWTDGAEYTFTDVLAANLATTVIFDEPADCRDTDRIDLLFLVDRSASIKSRHYDAARAIIRDVVGGLVVSPSQANVAIANFDVASELVSDFFAGTSARSVDGTTTAMSCGCEGTLDQTLRPREVGKQATTCCARRTSIGAAIDFASSLFATHGRPHLGPTILTRRVVVVLTDGVSTTLRDGVTPCSRRECRRDLAEAIDDLRQAHAGVEIYGAPIGTTTRRLAYRLLPPLSELAPSDRCSAGDVCTPATCGGFCECSECAAPSACDASSNYCKINTIVAGGTRCELVDRDCASLYPNRCDNAYCDEAAQACATDPIVCPASPNPSCFNRSCLPTTGECITDISPDPTCTDECTQDSDCYDDNLCTHDRCVQTDTFKVCKFIPRTCDDGDPCTEDSCTSATRGCEARPRPSTYCDDAKDCTLDTCIAGEGCRHEPLPCDDGQSCTLDVCDADTGQCLNRDCPEGTTSLLGACWVESATLDANGQPGVADTCTAACGRLGLAYDVATRSRRQRRHRRELRSGADGARCVLRRARIPVGRLPRRTRRQRLLLGLSTERPEPRGSGRRAMRHAGDGDEQRLSVADPRLRVSVTRGGGARFPEARALPPRELARVCERVPGGVGPIAFDATQALGA
jgi:hypothetical protein